MKLFNRTKTDQFGNTVESQRRITPKKGAAVGLAALAGATGAYFITEPGNTGIKDPFAEGSGVTQPAEVRDNAETSAVRAEASPTTDIHEDPSKATITLTVPQGGTLGETVDEFRDAQAGTDVDSSAEVAGMVAEYGVDPRNIQGGEEFSVPVEPPSGR